MVFLTRKYLFGLEKLRLHLGAYLSEYGTTINYPSAPKSAFMMPVCSVYCFTVLKPGRHYRRQESRLSVFHTRCLRSIPGVTWKEKLPNEELFKITKPQPLSSRLKFIRLRWAGHVTRMEPHRLPRSILYGALEQGDRPAGRPKLRFKDVLRDLVDFQSPPGHGHSWRVTDPAGGLCCTKG